MGRARGGGWGEGAQRGMWMYLNKSHSHTGTIYT